MENQHRNITGYRELSQVEIDLMNKIKAQGEALEALCDEVGVHVNAQFTLARDLVSDEELRRLLRASPLQWLSLAREGLQVDCMKLTRAVAQPTTF